MDALSIGLVLLIAAIAAVPVVSGLAGLTTYFWVSLLREIKALVDRDIASIHERVHRTWERRSEAIKQLADRPGFRLKTDQLAVGEIDGRLVEVDVFGYADGKYFTRIVMHCDESLRNMVLKPEDFGSTYLKFIEGTDEVLGDSDFDQKVVARGGRGPVTAKLSEEARSIVLEIISGGTVLEGQKLTRTRGRHYKSVEEIEEVIESMRRVANALADTGEPEEQLLYNNVCVDSGPEVRARNLGMLAVDHPETEALRDGLKAVLGEDYRPGALDEAQEAAFMELLAAPERGKPEVPLDRQVAAAIVLGMGGSGSAVPFLRDWASPFPLEQHYAKRVGHLAVAGIQKRVGPIEGGALSLSEVPMGAVSVAQGQGGELSVAEEEARRKKQGAALKGRQGQG